MPRPLSYTANEQMWQDFLQKLDHKLDRAIDQYAAKHGDIPDSHIGWAFKQLSYSGDSLNPDYGYYTVPILYSMRYVIQRMTTVAAALDLAMHQFDLGLPENILDLGSGADSVSLALQAAGFFAWEHHVTCVESQPTMIEFARKIGDLWGRSWEPQDLFEFCEAQHNSTYDAIFLSYAFNYNDASDHARIHGLACRMQEMLKPGGLILYSGPSGQGKKGVAKLLRDFLDTVGEMQVVELSTGWSPHLWKPNIPMPKLKRRFDEWVRRGIDAGYGEVIREKYWHHETNRPSIVFTCTTEPQEVFAAFRR
jgi:hypothetical protein